MFTSVITTAFFSAAFVAAAPVVQRGQPADWAAAYLEPYPIYHTRYLALDCEAKHQTTFFDDCCHPLQASQSLADRKPYCSPNASAVSSASDYTETATATGSADLDAATQYISATSSVMSEYVSVTAAEASSSTTISDAVADWAKQHTSTSTYEAPTSTSTYKAPTSTSTQAAATSAASSSSDVKTGGFATYFWQNGQAGECGTVHSDSDLIAAIDYSYWPDFETNSNSQYCGRSITLTNTNNGKSVKVKVADVCPTCDTDNSLDLSYGAFTSIADASDGEVPITWYFS